MTTDMNDKTEALKADFHVTKEQFEALKNAEVIRLTNGQEYIKKEIFESQLRQLRKELVKTNKQIIGFKYKLAARNKTIQELQLTTPNESSNTTNDGNDL